VPKKQLVFLSGTRKVERLPGEVTELLEEFIASGDKFIVGDAPGSDTAFQRYLVKQRVNKVVVYSSASHVRNNLGNWPSQFVDSGLKTKTNAMHAAKDRRMAQLCDLSIAIWDGQSAGTLANVLDVIDQGKTAFLYNYLEHELVKFDNQDSLLAYLDAFAEIREMAQKRLKRDRKRRKKQGVNQSQCPDTLF